MVYNESIYPLTWAVCAADGATSVLNLKHNLIVVTSQVVVSKAMTHTTPVTCTVELCTGKNLPAGATGDFSVTPANLYFLNFEFHFE